MWKRFTFLSFLWSGQVRLQWHLSSCWDSCFHHWMFFTSTKNCQRISYVFVDTFSYCSQGKFPSGNLWIQWTICKLDQENLIKNNNWFKSVLCDLEKRSLNEVSLTYGNFIKITHWKWMHSYKQFFNISPSANLKYIWANLWSVLLLPVRCLQEKFRAFLYVKQSSKSTYLVKSSGGKDNLKLFKMKALHIRNFKFYLSSVNPYEPYSSYKACVWRLELACERTKIVTMLTYAALSAVNILQLLCLLFLPS